MEEYKDVRDRRIDMWMHTLRGALHMLLFLLAGIALWKTPTDVVFGDVTFVVWIMTLLNLVDGSDKK